MIKASSRAPTPSGAHLEPRPAPPPVRPPPHLNSSACSFSSARFVRRRSPSSAAHRFCVHGWARHRGSVANSVRGSVANSVLKGVVSL